MLEISKIQIYLFVLFIGWSILHQSCKSNSNNTRGEKLAKTYCVSCHSSLKNIRNERSDIWLYNFIENPSKMILADSIASRLAKKYKPVVMTGFPNLTHKEIDAILDYYDSKTK